MKVTNEEKIIIRFLKKERDEAKEHESKARKELIEKLQGPCELADFQDYFDAVSDFFMMNGTYGAYVDEISTRFRNEIYFKS